MKVTIAHLQKWYAEYNNNVFGHALPTTMSFILTNTRTYLGRASWHKRDFVYSYNIKISNYFDCAEDDFRTILVHEMCHIYCYVKGYYKEHHGARWKAIAARASAMTGFNITRTANITNWVVSEENRAREERRMARKQARKEKPAIIVEFKKEGSQVHYLIRTSDSVVDRELPYFPRNGWSITNIYETTNSIFNGWTIKRNFNRVYGYNESHYNKVFKPIFELAPQRQILSARRVSLA